MKKRLKKIGRFIAFTLLGLLGVLIVGIGAATYTYQRIVNKVPARSSAHAQPGTLGRLVNPFIGTGGFPSWVCGFDYPGAMVPFGMVRLGPETMSRYKDTKDYSKSGYYYADSKIIGFSHTRLVGTGAIDGGHFLFTPTTRPLASIDFTTDHTHTFSHTDETAFPGYYSVHLRDEGILAECTATPRTGLQRYTFVPGSDKHLIIHITNALGGKPAGEGEVQILPESHEVEGSVRTRGTFAGRFGGIKVYFVARFNQAFQDYGTWNGTAYQQIHTASEGDRLKVALGFAGDTVGVKVGLSYVSLDHARENLEREAIPLAFGNVLAQAKGQWEKRLEKIQIEGGSEEERQIFYSALYRCFQMPTVFNDVDGTYIGFDKQPHQTTDFNYYTDISLWDTYRTVHPLYNLIARKEQRDMVVSLLKMAEQGGSLPRWPMGYGYTNSMFGSPADMMIPESYLKGIRDFDVEFAYSELKKTALAPLPKASPATGREEIEGYLKYGYCPTDFGKEAVSKTLEYAWGDHAIGLLAGALGKTEDQELFQRHAQFYKNLWNPETRYFQARYKDGRFVEKFDPLQLTYTDWDQEYTKDYVEGNALQWRWCVPHDPQGLIALFGSEADFVSELDHFFASADPTITTWIPDTYYWHGNQPDIHAAYLFNAAGRPDLTQKWVRWILDHKYNNTYVGLDGNDDGGTLSAWYVFSALGFYPIAGTDIYQLGAPLFPKAILNLGESELTVGTTHYAPENRYVSKVWLNGTELQRSWLRHDEIAQGGTLVFDMSPTPKINDNKKQTP